ARHAPPPLRIVDERGHRRRQRQRVVGGDQHPLRLVGEDLAGTAAAGGDHPRPRLIASMTTRPNGSGTREVWHTRSHAAINRGTRKREPSLCPDSPMRCHQEAATKERSGINPFKNEPTICKAKPGV